MICSESGEKSASDQALFTRQNSSKQICGWILMWKTTADGLFHWRKHYYGLWTHILAGSISFKLKTSWWICFIFCLLQMLTDGLEWCGLLVDYCDVFISCLDSHSDGTHSLQSIHCWARCNATFLKIWWRNKLIYILDGLRMRTFFSKFSFLV